jgi:hypothetical protein
MNQSLSDFRSQSAPGGSPPAAGEAAPSSDNPYQSPEITEPPEIEVDQVPEYSPLEGQIAVLMQQGKNGANWFYWIAGFSLVNSFIMLVGGGTIFVMGLAATLIVDGFSAEAAQQAPAAATVIKVIAFALNVVVALFVCGFGWLAGKRYQPLFAVGMVLYLLDGLLFLMFGHMMAAAFHAYGLYCMWSGFRAYSQLAALERQLMDPQHPVGEFNPMQPVPTDAT